MVYVPQASFPVGSGGAETDAFFTYPDTTQPYIISSENAIPIAAVNGQLFYNHNSSTSGDGIGPIPAAFPKGYNAFYCMKYEITQDQYVAFLNSIDSAQLLGRISLMPTSTHTFRNGISGTTAGNITALNPYLPCNYLDWVSLTAYLDWAALRPMSELEYEKACRGTALALRNEFAWGSDGLFNYDHVTQIVTTGNPYTLSNPFAKDEGIATNYSSAGNAVWYATDPSSGVAAGSLRAGIFAGNAGNSGRVTAGASFYGIMEMSGNLTEQVVTVGDPDGRTFTGQHGDGILRVAGDPNVPDWPYFNGTGFGLRGGSFEPTIPVKKLTVSDRSDAANHSFFFVSSPYAGGRGVRTAP
jgi:formylglycine-generating enzyme required for sulfatase activity